MTKYQKYAEYKDSGVKWLGTIPSHWNLSKVKYIGMYLNGFAFKQDQWTDHGMPIIRIQNLSNQDAEINRTKFIPPERYRVKAGDILISWSATLDVYVWNREHAWLNQHIFKVSTNKHCIDSQFFYWTAKWFMGELNESSHGSTMQHLTADKFGGFNVPLPEIGEQKLIANFLDHETVKIDTLIAKQEKLIELLKEKRQAVISHAVTKGLNPNAPMKDSAVEWLGDVPEHWDVCKIQYYAKIESGHTPSKTNEKYWENCTIPWVSLNDSKQLRVVDYITDTKYQISELGLANSSARILPKETVVFTRDASIGLSAITTREMAVSQHLIAWLPNKEKLSPEFLLLIFYAMEKEFNRYTFGSTIKTIGMDDVSSLMASFPPLAEQLEIVSRSFSQFELIDTSIEKSNCLLNILKERRTALISAAVTGKIDVRNWQNSNQKNEVNAELCA